MKARRFHHQSRSRVVAAISPIAHEDDDQIETWMIGQGQELSGNRHTVVYPRLPGKPELYRQDCCASHVAARPSARAVGGVIDRHFNNVGVLPPSRPGKAPPKRA
jgi:hypothetical protein